MPYMLPELQSKRGHAKEGHAQKGDTRAVWGARARIDAQVVCVNKRTHDAILNFDQLWNSLTN